MDPVIKGALLLGVIAVVGARYLAKTGAGDLRLTRTDYLIALGVAAAVVLANV